MDVTRLTIPRCDVLKYGNEPCKEPAEFKVGDGKREVVVCGSHVTAGIKHLESVPKET